MLFLLGRDLSGFPSSPSLPFPRGRASPARKPLQRREKIGAPLDDELLVLVEKLARRGGVFFLLFRCLVGI